MPEETKTKRKRQYSRNGCKECKRRKLKCDEGKPECWQCSHLGKTCIYVKNFKFSDSRSLTAPHTVNLLDKKNIKIEYNILNGEKSGINTSPTNTVTSETRDKKEIINEASVLANDLFESAVGENSPLDDFIMDLTLNEMAKKQNVLSSFDLLEPHNHYLEIFYDKISAWLMPLEQNLCNEILISHAKTSPYLLAAMLSLAAKEDSKLKYISTCLKNMNTVFQNHANILQNIEPLILTVLLLAADSTSNNWRVHLRGAKDLFNKYIKIYQTSSLLLAKSWFAAIEILACLTTYGTGKAHELDNLLDVGLYGENSEFAIEIGLLMPNGYNLFLGYSTEAIIMYREFFKLKKLDSMDLLFQMSLIHSAKEFQVANSTIVITKENPMHPNFNEEHQGQGRIILPASCYGVNSDLVYSWFDLIHQLHVDALLLKIYNDFLKLPTTHYLVQDLVKRMLKNCYFYRDNQVLDTSDTRLLMLHGPLLACGMNCIDTEDKLKVGNYFKCLMQLEIYSANYSYRRIQNKWNGVDNEEVMDLVPFA